MTQRQAWLTMARVYETKQSRRTKGQPYLTHDGICDAIDILSHGKGDLLSFSDRRVMLDIIEDSMPPKPYGNFVDWFCPIRTRRSDALRADYCRFQYYRLGGKTIE